MTGEEAGAMAVTIQPATGTELLPAMALWHGLTPKSIYRKIGVSAREELIARLLGGVTPVGLDLRTGMPGRAA